MQRLSFAIDEARAIPNTNPFPLNMVIKRMDSPCCSYGTPLGFGESAKKKN